ncbi:nucleoside-diphosphate-sugar epimerase [Mucilaginibacter gracilis]|uniref:Nucleoside-diphosphate-sugar epimerase n=1 Tax=Mucilaginibacter gracilis TaxID=423350 RepID=A0A495J949_9SPHI|nr:SDR family oxidoreductase [Mucilaginibacter gracilis]RKR84924.1 nucleoside-diphosphate-sugar epimerase [Mucilaginibacter gracilis]
MKVFVTGATGFVGTAIVKDLIANGHQILGLARSDASAQALVAAGAEVHRGDLEDLDSLRSGAQQADGVIHAGFIHDFARFAQVCEVDKAAIQTIGKVLAGSNRPFIVTSGTALVNPGSLATEDMTPNHEALHFPRRSEETSDAVAELGVRTSVVRLSPSVHGEGDHGFVPILINIAREKGFAAYIGEGNNLWTGVQRFDTGSLYRLALEKGTPKARFHGVAEEGIAFKDIAQSIGAHLNIPVKSISPEEAAAHFGWFAAFAAIDCPASSKLTRQKLGWEPTGVTLLEDMAQYYFKS